MTKIANLSRRKDQGSSSDSTKRRAIMRALHKCIFEKGYSKSSLTDIAIAAQMSPSHIRYYFNGKDAIVEHYLRDTCAHILSRVKQIDTSDPDQWLEDFVSYFIGNERIKTGRMSVLVEIFGISVHDPVLKEIKARYDQEIRALLEIYFTNVGCQPGMTPKLAAEITQSLESGFKYNAVFQPEFDADRAREVFLSVVQRLVAN